MSIPTDLAAVSPSTSDRARRQPEAHRRTRRKLVAIAGGPNCGKSTLFNRLTGLRQKVANYPGVTVEKKAGFCPLASGRTVEVLDLPGTYSLRPGSPDEVVVRDVLLGVQSDTPLPDLTLLVLDATCLERQLYLCMQLIEIGRPVVVALNMMDTADEEGLHVDAPLLERTFGAPVIPISAKTGSGLRELREAMEQDVAPPRPVTRTLAAPLLQAAQKVAGMLPSTGPLATLNRFHVAMALLLDEGEDDSLMRAVPPAIRREVLALRALLNAEIPERSHEPIGHYRSIEDLIRRATLRVKPETSVRERIDRVLTHRVFGPLIFIAFMAVIFQSLFMWAQPLMNAIDFGVSALGRFIGPWLPAGPIRSLVVDGAIAGVGAVVTFVPQIAFLFLFISLMEDSGYLARAAFIMDRLMRGVGLSGRAFIPLLSSFACAIPGIMATRTIDNRRDRLTTILIAPFMSCSARLPVYALLIGAFIPNRTVLGILNLPGLVLFCLYVLGILAAVVVAWALKRTALRGARPLYVMELPPYRVPSWRSVLVTVRDRAGLFVQKAGTVILAVSIVLWFLASYPKNAEVKPLEKELQKVEQSADQAQAQGQRAEAAASRAQAVHLENEIAGVSLRDSFAGRAGRLIEPAIAPLGFDWKIGIALLSSFAAREVMVSTMATVYNLGDADQTSVSLREKLRHAEDPRTGEKAYSPLMAVSLMVFFVLACQCMSTVAVVRRETNSWGWPIFMVVMMNALAWIASFAVFQGGRMLGLG